MGALDLLSTPVRQAAGLRETAHRPWPLRAGSWLMGQTWENLLFAHWPVDAGTLRALLPDAVELDTFDGRPYLGITPFRVRGLRLRGTLPVPVVSSFLELNVRTYVTAEDKPGIWFFSLDASSQLAVEAARRAYRLPYFRARITATRNRGWIDYECSRLRAEGRVFSGRYRPVGDAFTAVPGTIEHFLTERYCLYTVGARDRLCRAEIHHPPWPLQRAEAEIGLTTIAPPEIELDTGERPLVHYADRQDVVIWSLEPVVREL